MKYSIIIPVYNKAKELGDAIDSILAQNTPNDYQIIIIDDGSNDNIKEIVDNYKSSKIIFYRKENGGVSSARNKGIELSEGEFICFLDADDLWNKNHLSELDLLIKSYPNNSLYITSHDTITDKTRVYSGRRIPSNFSHRFETTNLFKMLNEYGDNLLHTNSVCIRRSIIDKYSLRFDEKSKIGEDTDMWYRVALRTNVAMSKTSTTSYRRYYSTATKNGFFNDNWVFANRLSDIVNDNSIPYQRVTECCKLIDRHILFTVRQMIQNGNKKQAAIKLKNINYSKGINYRITKILLRLPNIISKRIISLRIK